MFEYRVVRKISLAGHRPYYHYFITVAYYDDNGKIYMIRDRPEYPDGSSVFDLQEMYIEFAEAFTKPILDFNNVPEPGSTKPKEIENWDIGEENLSTQTLDDIIDFNEEEIENIFAKKEEDRKTEELKYSRNYVGNSIVDSIETMIDDYLCEDDNDEITREEE